MITDRIYKRLVETLNIGEKAAVLTTFENNNRRTTLIPDKTLMLEDTLYTPQCACNADELVTEKVNISLRTGNLQLVEDPKKTYLVEPYFPEPRLIILGGGHIAKPLCEFGMKAGFSVTVVDDRPSFANKGRFPDAENVICESFEKCFSLLELNTSSYVVIVTRGHRYDTDCLRQVLKRNTSYVGMIGSRRRVKSVKEQLLNEGYTQEMLDRVNAPIGLEIGAVTPEEIAIAIIAQVISYRRLNNAIRGPLECLRVNWPENDRDVLLELSREKVGPLAIATIVAARGSVPRKAGAKMLIWPDGRTIGSIGGGCTEGEVIKDAIDVIREGGYSIKNLDLTGYIAEEEGMVCGGTMQVIIEYFCL